MRLKSRLVPRLPLSLRARPDANETRSWVLGRCRRHRRSVDLRPGLCENLAGESDCELLLVAPPLQQLCDEPIAGWVRPYFFR